MTEEEKQFCCEDMKDVWASGPLLEMTEEDEKHPTRHQKARTYDFPDEWHPVKKGELYLYEDELSQIYGKPFRFCPFCGKNLENFT